jgi:hypothetical protein
MIQLFIFLVPNVKTNTGEKSSGKRSRFTCSIDQMDGLIIYFDFNSYH